ncbi:MAG: Crp/Fnr family transcriptional regulator [Acutalibacter sp.]
MICVHTELHTFFRTVLNIKDNALVEDLAAHSSVHTVRKRTVFQNTGEISQTVDILIRGLVRGFFLDNVGREITDCFALEPGTPLVTNFELGKPALISLEALDECTYVSIPLEYLMPLLKNPEILGIYNWYLTCSLRRHWEAKMMLSQYTARERYLWFLEKYPGVIDKVSHRHIASFLGITAVSLSRVRRDLREREAGGAAS